MSENPTQTGTTTTADNTEAIENIEVLDVADGVALPEVGASSGDWLCCSSSSSSSCC